MIIIVMIIKMMIIIIVMIMIIFVVIIITTKRTNQPVSPQVSHDPEIISLTITITNTRISRHHNLVFMKMKIV